MDILIIKRIVGASLLLLIYTIVFIATIVNFGFKDACKVVGISTTLTIVVVFAAWLLAS